MKLKERYQACIEYFSKTFPDAQTELAYQSPFQLLIAVILSAQCTDKRVNQVSPQLFGLYPTAEAMSKASPEEVFELIKSISYPNSKSRYLCETAQIIHSQHQGRIPQQMNELVALPGVGRKTANVIQSVLFGKSAMAVDTHVFRVSQRIGLVAPTRSFLKVETQLMRNFSDSVVPMAHHWLILHGRYTCLARSPKCLACGLKSVCKYYQIHNKPYMKTTKQPSPKKLKPKTGKLTPVAAVKQKPAQNAKILKNQPAQKTLKKDSSISSKSLTQLKPKQKNPSGFKPHVSSLKVGDLAPSFKAQDQHGKWINSKDFKGKTLLLYFYPKDDTPGCTKEACNLRDHHSRLVKSRYVVLGVSADSVSKHNTFAQKYDLPFSLLADTDKTIIKSFDVWGPKQFMGKVFNGIHRNTFVINEKGIITKIIHKVDTGRHAEQILAE